MKAYGDVLVATEASSLNPHDVQVMSGVAADMITSECSHASACTSG